MANKHDLEVLNFINTIAKGVEPDKVIVGDIDLLNGKYSVFLTTNEAIEDMKQKGVNVRYVYYATGTLSKTLFNINGDIYQVVMILKPEYKYPLEMKFSKVAMLENNRPVNKKDTPFADINQIALCRYLAKNLVLDEALHERIHTGLYFNLTMYQFDIGLKKIPKFDVSEDKADEKFVESLQEILNNEPIVAFYENSNFKYAKIRVVLEVPSEDESGEVTYAYKIAKVWLEERKDGLKVLKSDMNLYDEDIYKSVRYDELITLLDKLEDEPRLVNTEIKEEQTKKEIAVKGFGK